jgi:transposase-like protein
MLRQCSLRHRFPVCSSGGNSNRKSSFWRLVGICVFPCRTGTSRSCSPSEVCTSITSRCGVGFSGMPQKWNDVCALGSDPTNDSWRVDETYIRVKGKWGYLYRAVDSSAATIDFLLSAKRDAAAAERFLGKALGGENHPAPRVINTDEHAGYPPAIVRLKAEEALKENCRHRPVQYLNNVLEQDQRAIKRRIRASQHFRSFWGAWRTIAGYEAIHMIRKGQAYGSAPPSSSVQGLEPQMLLFLLLRRIHFLQRCHL